MNISLKLSEEDRTYQAVTAGAGDTIEDLYRRRREQVPRTVIAARRNNKLVALNTPLADGDRVVFLDVRSQAARLIYQHSLVLVYLKAIEEVIGRVRVEVLHSLGRGLYTEIGERGALLSLSEEQLAAITRRMQEIIAADHPFRRMRVDREEALRILRETDQKEKLHVLETRPGMQYMDFYDLDGFKNFFYGLMVPSTGYLYSFAVRRYRRGVILGHPQQQSPDAAPRVRDDRKLYDAFLETQRWHEAQGIHYVADLNEKVAAGESREIIQLSEALQEKRIVEIAAAIMRQKKRIILIAGPSSSGKTTFARKLCIQLQVEGVRPLYLGTDDYFHERAETPLDEKGERNYEDLAAVDVELFNRQMNALLRGEEVDLPTFDFLTGRKVFGRRLTRITARQPIVIEGIHALNDELTPHIHDREKYRIYISPLTPLNIDEHNCISVTDARMVRRLVRDHKYRGHAAARTIHDWPRVRAGEDKNIFPYNSRADAFFNSSHLYELGVLKKYAVPLLEAITREQEEYGEAVRMLRFLSFFRTIEHDELIPNNSLLREFIGGSVFLDEDAAGTQR